MSEMTKANGPGAKTSGKIDLGRNVLILHDTLYMQIVCVCW